MQFATEFWSLYFEKLRGYSWVFTEKIKQADALFDVDTLRAQSGNREIERLISLQ
jgi:hypothetical protein